MTTRDEARDLWFKENCKKGIGNITPHTTWEAGYDTGVSGVRPALVDCVQVLRAIRSAEYVVTVPLATALEEAIRRAELIP